MTCIDIEGRQQMDYVIAGLGNPGRKYAHTRHNAGFDAVDLLAEKYDIRITGRRKKSKIGRGVIEGMNVILVKPQTFMNLSGEALKEIVDAYHVKPENVVVLSDDIHLNTGSIRVRNSGSAGGHNGLKNIILHLGTDGFKRVRIGVGPMPEDADQIAFVLSRLTKEERSKLDEALKDAGDAVVVMLKDGPEKAMNLYNGKKRDEIL